MEEATHGNLVRVGERIKQARTESGLTQDELAELIGVGMRQVQYYEAGDSNPYRKLSRIAEVTNRTVGWILHGDDASGPAGSDVLLELRELIDAQHDELVGRLERIEELARAAAARPA